MKNFLENTLAKELQTLNPDNLFPLLELNSYDYSDAQNHAALLDRYFDFQCEKIEKTLYENQILDKSIQNWSHLSPQSFQTPYVELRFILEQLQPLPKEKIIDLGCAYGRMGLVLHFCHPEVLFIGYELEKLRVQEANRIYKEFKISDSIQILQADLQSVDFQIPTAESYFIFDYGSEFAVRQTLRQLQKVATKRNIRVIARGRLVRFLIHQEHPWLCEVNKPAHFPHFSIYRS